MNLQSFACGPSELGQSAGAPPRFTNHRIWSALAGLLLLSWAVVIFLTFQNYGITFDEADRSAYGEHIVQWYASGFKDTRALSFFSYWPQGALFNVLERLARRISPFGGFETSHLLNALFGLAAVWGAFRLGRLAGGRLAGFIAAAFLLLTPSFYGHSFNNPVDIPVAALSAFAIYYLMLALRQLPRLPAKLIWKLGIVTGLALGVRVGSILLIAYIAFGFLLWHTFEVINNLEGPRRIWHKSVVLRLAGTFALICVIAYVVMLIWWPAAQVQPLYQPARGLWFATHFNTDFPVFFEGKAISNHHLPWYYVSKSFLITLPEFYFVGFMAVIVIACAHRRPIRENRLPMIVLATSAFLPVIYTAIAHPPEYDGMRHYLFVLPSVAAVCGVAVTQFLEWRPKLAVPAIILIICSMAVTGADLWQLHPDQYVYYNRLFGGGLNEAAKSFDTDYWGNSYKEGVEWLVSNYKQPNKNERIKVGSCSYSLSTSYFLPRDKFDYIGSFEKGQMISGEPDVFLATTRWNCDQKVQGKVIHVVERQNTPLLLIKEVAHDSPGRGLAAGRMGIELSATK